MLCRRGYPRPESGLLRLPLLLVLLVAAGQAAAQVSGGLAALSDYRFRGISLSDRLPALQGWLAYDHPSGVYAGVLVSTIRIYGVEPDLAAEVYGGYAYALSPRAALDATVSRYLYPESSVHGSYDFNDVALGASLDRMSARVHFSDDYFGSGYRAVYVELNTALPLYDQLSLVGHFGELGRSGGGAYPPTPRFQADAKLGLVWTVAGFALELSVVGTDIPVSSCPLPNRSCAAGVVLAVSREF